MKLKDIGLWSRLRKKKSDILLITQSFYLILCKYYACNMVHSIYNKREHNTKYNIYYVLINNLKHNAKSNDEYWYKKNEKKKWGRRVGNSIKYMIKYNI